MAKILKINETTILIDNSRVFLPSNSIKIFPCSRRGQYSDTGSAEYYDPEARLNTERTNRISTAINGFTDSFIVNREFNDNDTLVFALAGYRVEVKNFIPSAIATALNITGGKIYAHLSLHEGISLNVEGYHTEILYRQSSETAQKNYLDVTYSSDGLKEDFFVGISFTNDGNTKDTLANTILTEHNLALFEKSSNSWELVQTSLLPIIKHGETPDSIIVGELNIRGQMHIPAVDTDIIVTKNARIGSLIVTSDGFDNSSGTITAEEVQAESVQAKEVAADKVTQNGKAVPAIDLVPVDLAQIDTTYQLQITLDASKK